MNSGFMDCSFWDVDWWMQSPQLECASTRVAQEKASVAEAFSTGPPSLTMGPKRLPPLHIFASAVGFL